MSCYVTLATALLRFARPLRPIPLGHPTWSPTPLITVPPFSAFEKRKSSRLPMKPIILAWDRERDLCLSTRLSLCFPWLTGVETSGPTFSILLSPRSLCFWLGFFVSYTFFAFGLSLGLGFHFGLCVSLGWISACVRLLLGLTVLFVSVWIRFCFCFCDRVVVVFRVCSCIYLLYSL